MAKVMIVDDSRFVLNRLEKLLTEQGYQTILAEDGVQAVETYPATRPDVVLMDITMPKMNGLDALAEICHQDPTAKVIMLTALDQQVIATRAIHLGASDFLVKPVLLDKLLRALQKAMGES